MLPRRRPPLSSRQFDEGRGFAFDDRGTAPDAAAEPRRRPRPRRCAPSAIAPRPRAISTRPGIDRRERSGASTCASSRSSKPITETSSRHPVARFLQHAHRAERERVVQAEDRVELHVSRRAARASPSPPFDAVPERGVDDDALVERDAGGLERLAVAPQPQPGRPDDLALVRADDRDPSSSAARSGTRSPLVRPRRCASSRDRSARRRCARRAAPAGTARRAAATSSCPMPSGLKIRPSVILRRELAAARSSRSRSPPVCSMRPRPGRSARRPRSRMSASSAK